MNILEKIVREKRKEIQRNKKGRPLASFSHSASKNKKINLERVFPKNKINIVGELKRKSPSGGILFSKERYFRVAKLYNRYCRAISVVTDKKFFGGSLEDLRKVKKTVSVPILRKDFIIDEYQVYESKYYGADFILLIAAILSSVQIEKLLYLARKLGMEGIVEVHNERELRKVLTTSAKIVGINNRNLKSFSIDLGIARRLAGKIPTSKIVIAESGIEERRDIDALKKYVRGFLIGTSLLKSKNPEAKLESFLQ